MIPIMWISRTGKIALIEIRSVIAWGEEGRLTERDTRKLSERTELFYV